MTNNSMKLKKDQTVLIDMLDITVTGIVLTADLLEDNKLCTAMYAVEHLARCPKTEEWHKTKTRFFQRKDDTLFTSKANWSIARWAGHPSIHPQLEQF